MNTSERGGIRGAARISGRLGIPGRLALAAGSIAVLALIATTGSAGAARGHAASATVVKKENWKGAKIVAAFNGHTLYAFSKDSGKSTCYHKCSQTWYPYVASGNVKAASGSSINQSQLKTTTRTNGKHQVTYYGQPLYLYKGDTKAGTVKGEEKYQFGGQWYALNVNGGPQTRPGY